MIYKKKTSYRTDIIFEKERLKFDHPHEKPTTTHLEFNHLIYQIITFSNINHVCIKEEIKKSLLYFLNYFNLPTNFHVFIIGLGNDNHTADSVGPKTLKHILVNSHIENLGGKLNYPKISALEPGALGETGIETKKIIESVTKEIKPDIMILVDSYVCNNIKYLNSCIQITNEGINPGSGLHSLNTEISFKTMKIPVLVIGVTTAIEIDFKNKHPYLLSTKDIDNYVIEISKVIGEAINEVLYYK